MKCFKIKDTNESTQLLILNVEGKPTTIKLENNKTLLEICKRNSYISLDEIIYSFHSETYSIDLNAIAFRYDKLDNME